MSYFGRAVLELRERQRLEYVESDGLARAANVLGLGSSGSGRGSGCVTEA